METPQKDNIFMLCDEVRQTAYDIHHYLGFGHLEIVYEKALAHRLRKKGFDVQTQYHSEIRDEDGEVLGIFAADLFVENRLVTEVKAVNALANEHFAQVIGYLRSSGIPHGMLINSGNHKFQAKKLFCSKNQLEPVSISKLYFYSSCPSCFSCG